MSGRGWIGVDLDGTLAYYPTGAGISRVGDPIPAMLERVKYWLANGWEVRVVTARVCSEQPAEDREAQRAMVAEWCRRHVGRDLAVTAEKDFAMVALFDDRAYGVEENTGRLGGPMPGFARDLPEGLMVQHTQRGSTLIPEPSGR